MPYRKVLPRRMKTRIGIVYLLHFDPPFKHASHYVGFTQDFDARMEDHQSGNGARLVKHAKAAGCTVIVAKVWENKPQTFEYALKNRGGKTKLCPVCQQRKRDQQAMEGM